MSSTPWSIDAYLTQLAHDLLDLHRRPPDEAMRWCAQNGFNLRRSLTPWLLSRQPLVDAQTLDDFSSEMLGYFIGLSRDYREVAVLNEQITASLGRFVRLLQQCESYLESAFLVGLAAYGGSSIGWPAIRNPAILSLQVPIENYRADLVLLDPAGNRRWVIELDGHTYHERTEEQASYDRARNRALTAADWTVLRFHRRDVDQDIRACIRELIAIYGPQSTPTASLNVLEIEEAQTALHEHQQRQIEASRDGMPQHADRYIATGFRDFNEVTNGLHRGDLMIVASPQGVGKTGFMLSLALQLAQNQSRVVVQSGEMSYTQIETRLLGILTSIPIIQLHNGALRDKQIIELNEAIGDLATLPLYIETPVVLTLESLKTSVTTLHAHKPIDVLIVDALHFMSHRNASYWKADATEIVLALKRLARALDVAVILAVSLERPKQPNGRSHINDVEAVLPALVSVADVITLLYREELYDRETDKRGIMEIDVVKNRSTGMIGVMPVRFESTTTSCLDLSYRSAPESE